MRKSSMTVAMVLTVVALLWVRLQPATGLGAQQDQQKPTYTLPEYNAFQACRAETNAQARVKCLDDFVAKFPQSTLMQYVYTLYYTTYNELKNYARTIEYADKYVALGDKVDVASRLQAIQTRIQLFPYALNIKAADANDQLTKERDAALLGAKLLGAFPKPANSTATDAQFAEQKKPGIAFFYVAVGFADFSLKDYEAAIQAYKTALSNNPNDAVTEYRLGLAYLQMTPPQSLDGFWALARAINQKIPDDAKVKDYLRKAMLNYEQLSCESLVDAQLSELLQLAMGSADRPATYTIPSTADLQKIAQSSTIVTLLNDLQAGGDKAKMTWLALCGLDFPEVAGKVIDVKPGTDFVELHMFTSASAEEMQAATTANMDVKVPGQPEAKNIQKEDGIRFSGTLSSYDPPPAFMLHWDKAKVNPEDISAAAPGKHTPHKVPPKNPGT
jgi:tetratricopeptide (TPR) repeat protein